MTNPIAPRLRGWLRRQQAALTLQLDERRIARSERAAFAEVTSYLMFVGYPRSGHTLLGSLLDAHPQATVAHELDVLGLLHANPHTDRNTVFAKLVANARRFHREGSVCAGYSYQVPNQWQGRYEHLRLIGDKKGGVSTKWIRQHPALMTRLLDTVRVPVKIIHYVRNPYDCITTRLRRMNDMRTDLNEAELRFGLENHFRDVETISQLRQDNRFEILDVWHEAMVGQPAEVLRSVCDFLGLAPSPAYLADCCRIVMPSPNRSRRKVTWPDDLVEEVARRAKAYDFLAGYAYEA